LKGIGTLPRLESQIRSEFARQMRQAAQFGSAVQPHPRPLGGPARDPCLRNHPVAELCASTRLLCRAIHAAASASLVNGLTVVGLLSGMLTSTLKSPLGREMTR
jgi:hypothetical protein